MKVIVPNKKKDEIDKILTDLYLLQVSLETENKEKAIERIRKIRDKLKKIKVFTKRKE